MESGVSTRLSPLLPRTEAVDTASTRPRRETPRRRVSIPSTKAPAVVQPAPRKRQQWQARFYPTLTDALATELLLHDQQTNRPAFTLRCPFIPHACPPSRAFSKLHIYRFVQSCLTPSQCIPYPTRIVFFMHVAVAAACSPVPLFLHPVRRGRSCYRVYYLRVDVLDLLFFFAFYRAGFHWCLLPYL